MLVTLLTVIISILQSIVLPALLGRSLQMINENEGEDLNKILFYIFIISMILGVFMIFNRWGLCALKQKLDVYLQRKLVHSLLADKTLYKKKKETLSAVLRDTVTSFSSKIVDYFSHVIQVLMVTVWGSIYSFYLNPVLYAMSIVIAIAMILFMRSRTEKLKEVQNEFEIISQEVNQKSWEQVKNHEIESFLNEDKLIAGYHKTNVAFIKKLFLLKKVGNVFQAITLFTMFIITLSIAALGGIFVLTGILHLAVLYQLLLVLPNICRQIFSIPELISQVSVIKGMSKNIDSNFSTFENTEEGKNITLKSVDELQIEQVSFGYAKEKLLFSDVSCIMKKGECWVFTGKIGCGKSTCLKLLAGIIPLQNGAIRMGGKEIQDLNRQSWWGQISYMEQIPHFIKGSIKENILLGEVFDCEKLRKVIEEADLEELIAKLPEGVDSSIEKLSSGEKQKVCFARVFYRNRKIILLDEATSAMDPDSEKKICKSLKKKTEEGWMIIGVSHRPEFTNLADKILHFDNGHAFVIEQ